MEVAEAKFTIRNDYAFKKVFGTEENKDILKRFLSVVLDISESSIQNIVLKNPFVSGRNIKDRQGITDIKAELDGNKKIQVEMQNLWHDYYEERVLFYWANRYTEAFKKGDGYEMLRKCVSINILNQPFPLSEELHSVYELLNIKDFTPFKDIMQLHFLDLTKVSATSSNRDLNKLEKWLLFIRTEDKKVRDKLAKEDEMMAKANDTMDVFYADADERYLYEDAVMYESDRATLIEHGRVRGLNEGMEKGLKKGMKEGRLLMALSSIKALMSKMSIDIDEAMDMLGISVEERGLYKNELKKEFEKEFN